MSERQEFDYVKTDITSHLEEKGWLSVNMNDLIYAAPSLIGANLKKTEQLLNKKQTVVVKSEWSQGRFINYEQPDCYRDFETEFQTYLSYYNMHAQAANAGMDNIPFFRVDFNRVAYQIAIAFGCKPIEIGTVINAKPIVYDVEDIYGLNIPERVEECGFYPEITKRMQEIVRRVGDVGFVSSDTQSPIDVLTEIVDMEECLCAMYDNSEPIHYLLDQITKAISRVTKYQKTLVKNWIGFGHDYPLPKGIHLSDDNAAFLSPETYKAFGRPYAERLAEEFGGATLHCCMGYKQNIQAMAETKGFLGFDPQLAFHQYEDILPHVQGRGFLRVFWPPEDRDRLDFYKEIIDKTTGLCGLMIDIFGGEKDDSLRLGYEVKNYAAKLGRA